MCPKKKKLAPKRAAPKSQILTFLKNYAKNPAQAVVDGLLYGADVLGAPSNVINTLRDWNVSIPYRVKAAVRTLVGGDRNKSFLERYNSSLANPNWFQTLRQITPLTNMNHNYSEEELQIIRDMVNGKDYIDNSDIRRVNNTYGSDRVSLTGYIKQPARVVETSIGQSGHSGIPGVVDDIFDVNTQTPAAKKDNRMYLNKGINNISRGDFFKYANLRGLFPFTNSTDNFPEQFKIRTYIDTNEK